MPAMPVKLPNKHHLPHHYTHEFGCPSLGRESMWFLLAWPLMGEMYFMAVDACMPTLKKPEIHRFMKDTTATKTITVLRLDCSVWSTRAARLSRGSRNLRSGCEQIPKEYWIFIRCLQPWLQSSSLHLHEDINIKLHSASRVPTYMYTALQIF